MDGVPDPYLGRVAVAPIFVSDRQIAVRESGPLTVVTLRLFMALVVLVVFLVIRKPGVPRGKRLWGVLLLQGLMSTAIPWIFITWAEKTIDSALATVLNATVPLFTLVVAHLFLSDDKMTLRRVAGLLVGFSGVVVLVHKDLFSSWTQASLDQLNVRILSIMHRSPE